MRRESEVADLIGLIYDAAGDPSLWPDLLTNLDLFLTEDGGAPGRRALLEPHFRRAIEMSRYIARLESERQTSTDILNRLPIGIMIVRFDGSVHAMNDQAGLLLTKCDALCLKDGILRAQTKRRTEQLHALIRGHAGAANTSHGASLLLPDSTSGQISLWIASGGELQGEDEDAASLATLYIAASQIRPEFSVDAIRRGYGLTEAEARLVRALANGSHSLNEAAARLGISVHTARSQAKSVYAKMGVSGQVELVKTVLGDPSTYAGKQPALQVSLSLEDNCRRIRLFDGRMLAWAEYGDPAGRPVFMAHGIAASRLGCPPDHDAIAVRGLRLIVPDRPGHGLSDFQPDRTVSDWPDDIVQLADCLEVEHFSMLGYVAGAAYALAAAHALPDRVSCVALASARGPVDSLDGHLSVDAMILRLSRYAPKLLDHYLRIMVNNITEDPVKKMQHRNRHLCASDRELMSRPDITNMQTRSLMEALRFGIDGVAQDIKAVMAPWGFSVSGVQQPVYLWHGEQDRAIPAKAARRLAAELPDCAVRFFPKQGAGVIIHQWEDILDTLAQSSG